MQEVVVRNRTQMLPTGTSDYTISFWLKFKDKTESCDLIRDVHLTNTNALSFILAYDTTAGIRLTTGTTSDITIPNTASGDLSNNVWYNVVCRNNGGTVYLYLNYNAQTSGSGTASSIGTGTNWAIAGQLGTTATLRGQIDDFCIWHKSISDTARQNLYNSGTGRVATDTDIASDIVEGMKIYYDCNSIGYPLFWEQLESNTAEEFTDVGRVRQQFQSAQANHGDPFGMKITKIGVKLGQSASGTLSAGDPTVVLSKATQGAYHDTSNEREFRFAEARGDDPTGSRYLDQAATSHTIAKENITTTASWFYVYGGGLMGEDSELLIQWGVSNGCNSSPRLIVYRDSGNEVSNQSFWYHSSSWTNRSSSDMTYKLYTTGVENQTPAQYPSPIATNLPNGAIFEESDTGKIYMFDGSQTWNEVT